MLPREALGIACASRDSSGALIQVCRVEFRLAFLHA